MERRKEVIEVEAVSGNLDRVTGFVEEQVLQMGCPPKLAMQIILAVGVIAAVFAVIQISRVVRSRRHL